MSAEPSREPGAHATSTAYVLGHSESELRRLNTQARVIDPITRRFVTEAGVGPGMRVLDVGSGAGDTALLLADVVGEDGEVVGLDRSADAVAVARAKVSARSLRNVTFVQGAADEVTFNAPFDAVVGRYVLQFQPDPAAMLAAVVAHAKPGALVLFHELDWSGASSVPPVPTFDRFCGWAVQTLERSGASAHMGLQLPAVFAAAGLPEPVLRLDGLIAAGEHARDLLELKGNLARTLESTMADYAIATSAELGADTLAERMISEAIANRSVLISRFEVAAWATLLAPPLSPLPQVDHAVADSNRIAAGHRHQPGLSIMQLAEGKGCCAPRHKSAETRRAPRQEERQDRKSAKTGRAPRQKSAKTERGAKTRRIARLLSRS